MSAAFDHAKRGSKSRMDYAPPSLKPLRYGHKPVPGGVYMRPGGLIYTCTSDGVLLRFDKHGNPYIWSIEGGFGGSEAEFVALYEPELSPAFEAVFKPDAGNPKDDHDPTPTLSKAYKPAHGGYPTPKQKWWTVVWGELGDDPFEHATPAMSWADMNGEDLSKRGIKLEYRGRRRLAFERHEDALAYRDARAAETVADGGPDDYVVLEFTL